MSASSRLLVVTALLSTGALADTAEEAPDVEFLEYLGLWEESDEEWMIFNTADDARPESQDNPAQEGEEPAENDDEE